MMAWMGVGISRVKRMMDMSLASWDRVAGLEGVEDCQKRGCQGL